MNPLYLGLAERVHGGPSSGPGARLRPLAEVGSEKFRWLDLRDEFPNSGVVSWWQPPADLLEGTSWLFHIELSVMNSYDPDNPHHDYYRVKGTPTPAVELLEFQEAESPEDVRQLLFARGVLAGDLSTTRVFLRDRSGDVVGRVELVGRDGRLYLDSQVQDIPFTVVNDSADLPVLQHGNHRFMHPNWSIQGEKADFSPDEVFLKRVLRELRSFSELAIDDIKLTNKLISRYGTAVASTTLTPAQRYRVKRLEHLTKQLDYVVTVPPQVVEDVLALPQVQKLLKSEGDRAVAEALAAAKGAIDRLQEKRTRLEGEVGNLNGQVKEGQTKLDQLLKQQEVSSHAFEQELASKLKAISENPTQFAVDAAIMRALVNVPSVAKTSKHPIPNSSVDSYVSHGQLTSTIDAAFLSHGLSAEIGQRLLISAGAGFVPLVCGEAAWLCCEAFGTVLAASRCCSIQLHGSMSSPTDISNARAISSAPAFESRTLEDFLYVAAEASKQLHVIVFENINLCQIDALILPLFRRYTQFRSGQIDVCPPGFDSGIGFISSNVLLMGTVLESQMALPASPELWTTATLLEALHSPVEGSGGTPGNTAMNLDEWLHWITDAKVPAGTQILFPAYVESRLNPDSVTRALFRKLCCLGEQVYTHNTAPSLAARVAEMFVAPYCISRGLDLKQLLRDSPVPVPMPSRHLEKITRLLTQWGFETSSAASKDTP